MVGGQNVKSNFTPLIYPGFKHFITSFYLYTLELHSFYLQIKIYFLYNFRILIISIKSILIYLVLFSNRNFLYRLEFAKFYWMVGIISLTKLKCTFFPFNFLTIFICATLLQFLLNNLKVYMINVIVAFNKLYVDCQANLYN